MQHAQHGTDDVLLASAAMTNSATRTANLDTVGKDYATIRINLSSEVNTNAVGPTLSLLECDTTVVTSFATITTDLTADCTAERAVTYHVDLRGRKRYLRLSVSTGTTTNDNVTVGALGTVYGECAQSSTTGMADQAVVV